MEEILAMGILSVIAMVQGAGSGKIQCAIFRGLYGRDVN